MLTKIQIIITIFLMQDKQIVIKNNNVFLPVFNYFNNVTSNQI